MEKGFLFLLLIIHTAKLDSTRCLCSPFTICKSCSAPQGDSGAKLLMFGCNRRQVKVKLVRICLFKQDPDISQLEGPGRRVWKGTSPDVAVRRRLPVTLVLIYVFLQLTLDGGCDFSTGCS